MRIRSLLALLFLPFIATPAQAQLLDKLSETVSDVGETVGEAQKLHAEAKDVQCAVQGVCGVVSQSDHFDPTLYSSLAVTAFDGSRRFRDEGAIRLAEDVIAQALLTNGFLLAASSDVATVKQQIGRSEKSWSDADLRQLSDFVEGIDAVLVLDIRQVELARCELSDGGNGTEATVHLSLRWLNVDAGDVPWVAKHRASACADGGHQALLAGLQTAAEQLVTNLPVYQ